MTNRALVLAALARGNEPSRDGQHGDATLLRRPLRSRDTMLMAEGLRVLGAAIEDAGTDWRVWPCPGRNAATGSAANGSAADGRVDVGNAGTVMRFLPPVAALTIGDVRFDGDARARERPLAPLLTGLRSLGVEIDDGGRGALPMTVRASGRVPGGSLTLDASGSSQLVSGLLLAAPRYDKGVELRHEGTPMPSAPHVAMTVSMLRAAGVTVETPAPDMWRVPPSPVAVGTIDIEPDLSNAAPFLAAALVTGGTVSIPGWPTHTTQAGDALRELLATMGASTVDDASGITVHGSGGIHGLDADLHDVGELTPVLAALAALADSPSRLRGVSHLRRHETDRLDALARELHELGGDVTQTADGLEIRPSSLHGGVFHTYDDHRLATAGAVLGLAVPGIEVENVATTSKTLPGFTELWAHMLAAQDGGSS